ncbi:uncharacterized protein [Dysidea avara]|uniref:uncharacterized protein n=1 Tax=Dysidea avara TaxID=196820 RepID=UPI00332E52DC
MSTAGEGSLYNCSFCAYRSNIKLDLIKHLFEAHGLDATFRYQCGISSCTRVFASGSCFDAFRGHCIRKHLNWQQMLTISLEPTQDNKDPPVDSTMSDGLSAIHSEGAGGSVAISSHDCEEASIRYSDVFTDDIEHGSNEQLTLAVQKETIKRDAAKFILNLKERYKLTQASLDYTIKAVDHLMFLSSKMAKQSLAEGDQGQYSSLFDDLQTEYLQTKYFKENFGLIEPVACELGTSFRYQQMGTKRRLVEVTETFQYVPLLPNLEKLLNNKDIFQEIAKLHARNDHLIGDFCDAAFYQNHSLFSNCDGSLKLQLILYYDDVEITNPLGSQRGKHKLGKIQVME